MTEEKTSDLESNGKFKKCINLLNEYSPLIISAIGICTLIVVSCELNNLSEQNDLLSTSVKSSNEQTQLLSKSIKDANRPQGVLKQLLPRKSNEIQYIVYPTKEKDKVSFDINTNLVNVGNGPLISLGYIYASLSDRLSLRKILIDNSLDGIEFKFDNLYDAARRNALSINDYQIVKTQFGNIEFQSEYFINILLFYEDLDGNLYDTENRLIINASKIILPNNEYKIKFDRIGQINNFNQYSQTELKSLFKSLNEMKNPIRKYISNRDIN